MFNRSFPAQLCNRFLCELSRASPISLTENTVFKVASVLFASSSSQLRCSFSRLRCSFSRLRCSFSQCSLCKFFISGCGARFQGCECSLCKFFISVFGHCTEISTEIMVAWSQLETDALYLGKREHGNDYAAIKHQYQHILMNRSPNACRKKVENDHRRFVKRQRLLQDLLQQHVEFYLTVENENHVAVQQIQAVQHGLAEGFPLVAPEEEILLEMNQLLQSIKDRFRNFQISVLAKFAEFKPYVVEVEEPQLEIEVNVAEEEQLKAQNVHGLRVFCEKLGVGCDKFESVVVKTLAILVAAFKRRFP